MYIRAKLHLASYIWSWWTWVTHDVSILSLSLFCGWIGLATAYSDHFTITQTSLNRTPAYLLREWKPSITSPSNSPIPIELCSRSRTCSK